MYSVSLSGMLNRFRYVVLCLLKYQERFSLDYKKIRIPMLCSIRTPIRLSIKNVRTLNVRSAICTRSRARTGTPYQYWCLRPTRLPIPPSGRTNRVQRYYFYFILHNYYDIIKKYLTLCELYFDDKWCTFAVLMELFVLKDYSL